MILYIRCNPSYVRPQLCAASEDRGLKRQYALRSSPAEERAPTTPALWSVSRPGRRRWALRSPEQADRICSRAPATPLHTTEQSGRALQRAPDGALHSRAGGLSFVSWKAPLPTPRPAPCGALPSALTHSPLTLLLFLSYSYVLTLTNTLSTSSYTRILLLLLLLVHSSSLSDLLLLLLTAFIFYVALFCLSYRPLGRWSP